MYGWIKLYRKFRDWGWHDHPNHVSVFIHLLILANHEDGFYKRCPIKRGQYITTIEKLSSLTGLTIRQTRTVLKDLKTTGELTIETTNRYSIVTICNYDIYQGKHYRNDKQCDMQKTNQTANNRHPNDNQTTNNIIYNKKDNIENNNIVSIEKIANATFSDKEEIDYNQFLVFFNETVKESKIPKIKSITEYRKNLVQARLFEHEKISIMTAVKKAAASNFLNGGGNKAFVATFDWIFQSGNFEKILEGNYDNNKIYKNGTNHKNHREQQRESERAIRADRASKIIHRLLEEDGYSVN